MIPTWTIFRSPETFATLAGSLAMRVPINTVQESIKEVLLTGVTICEVGGESPIFTDELNRAIRKTVGANLSSSLANVPLDALVATLATLTQQGGGQ